MHSGGNTATKGCRLAQLPGRPSRRPLTHLDRRGVELRADGGLRVDPPRGAHGGGGDRPLERGLGLVVVLALVSLRQAQVHRRVVLPQVCLRPRLRDVVQGLGELKAV
jgi:hypothetical protein